MTLAEAKTRLTIFDLWPRYNFKGEPSKLCLCPFHDDHNPSFSVTPDGKLFICRAGCGGGSAVDFLALATGLQNSEACRQFIRIAEGSPSFAPARPILPRISEAEKETQKEEVRKAWPRLESPVTGIDDTPFRAMGALAKLRSVSLEGVKLAAMRGLLYFAAWKDSPAFIVTDITRVNAQARRMDGRPWPGIDAKAQTLPGSIASWPIGAKESAKYPFVILCEGGPDLLAAHHFIAAHGREGDTAAVAMLGAGMEIHAAALPLFAGKRVRIMAHADQAGREAAAKWAEQLASVRARVDAADFTGLLMADGSPVKDLNDCTRLDLKQTSELDNLIPNEDLQPA